MSPDARLAVVVLGRGRVGSRLVEQLRAAREGIAARYGVVVTCEGAAGRNGGADLLARARRTLRGPRLLVDATAADGLAATHESALQDGFHVVTCNKKPLAGPLREYRAIASAARAAGRFHLHEVTVGAGLPILSTLADLVDGGDRLESIEGCVSGTLNFLCARLETGTPFSRALGEAEASGLTEPDPREDLLGLDVARKALILARDAGLAVEPEAAPATPFCRPEADLAELDAPLAARVEAAAARGARLRYVAQVDLRAGTCRTGLREVAEDGPLGRLRGPENVFVVRSERYHHTPLVVAGPGAGPEVTAAGALADILKVVRALAGAGGRER